jgi:hypothetical protein
MAPVRSALECCRYSRLPVGLMVRGLGDWAPKAQGVDAGQGPAVAGAAEQHRRLRQVTVGTSRQWTKQGPGVVS